MSETWNYRHDVDVVDVDLVGFDVEASDGKIGKVDESSVDVGDAFLVVDTGFWIFGHKRVIPAPAVKQINTYTRMIYLDLTKDEVKSAPDHHADWSSTPEERDPFVAYYGRFHR